jgi:hypothetical protein
MVGHHTSAPCGLYYKPMTTVNDDSRVINKLEASLTDDARVIIYDCHMFMVQGTGDVILAQVACPMNDVTFCLCK